MQQASGVVFKTCLCLFGSSTFNNLSAGLKLFGSSHTSLLKWVEGLHEFVGDLSAWDIHGLWPQDSQTPKLPLKKSVACSSQDRGVPRNYCSSRSCVGCQFYFLDLERGLLSLGEAHQGSFQVEPRKELYIGETQILLMLGKCIHISIL